MRTVPKSIAALVLTALVATACSQPEERQYNEGAPNASAPKPDGLLTAVTGWEKSDSPTEQSRYFRLVVVKLPNGNQICAMQIDGGSRDTGANLTVLEPGNCAAK